MATCQKAPKDWKCTREVGHDGPCAAVKTPWWQRAIASIGNAIGEAKFGE